MSLAAALLWTCVAAMPFASGGSTADAGVPGLQLRAATLSDRDGDGIDNALDGDDDNDLVADVDEPAGDADGDGVPNGFDADADNDGVADLVEAVGDRALLARLDANGDGLLDAGVALGANGMADIAETSPDSGAFTTGRLDGDGDGVPDPYDLDSDNDGLTDLYEAGGADADGDARVDRFRDFDANGRDDQLSLFPIVPPDTDEDGRFDFRDVDSDGDGASDRRESSGVDTDGDGVVDGFRDGDGDGLDDRLAGAPVAPIDVDGDRLPDHLDAGTAPRDTVTPPDPVPDPPAPEPPAVDPPGPVAPAPGGEPGASPGDGAQEGGANGGAGRPVTGRAGNPIGGCSIGPSSSASPSRATDVSLGATIALALAVLGARAGRRRAPGRGTATVRVAVRGAVLVVAASALAGCASATRFPSALDVDGLHAGATVGASRLDADTADTTFVADERGSTSVQLTLGAALAPWLDAEIRAADLGDMTFVGGGRIGYRVLDAGAVVRHRRGPIVWFGRFGAGALFNDGDIDVRRRNPVHLSLGVGGDVPIAPDWRLRVEASGHDVDAVHAGVGVLYRFGRPTRSPPSPLARADERPSAPESDAAPETTPVIRRPSGADPTGAERGALLIEPIATRAPPAPVAAREARPLPDIAPRPASGDARRGAVGTGAAPFDRDETVVARSGAGNEPPPSGPRGGAPEGTRSRTAAIDDASEPRTAGAGEPASVDPIARTPDVRFDPDAYEIRFDGDSDRLTAASRRTVLALAEALETSPATELVVVARPGSGADPRADLLSRRRALAVVRALGKAGIDVARLRPEVRSGTGAGTVVDEGRVRFVERDPSTP